MIFSSTEINISKNVLEKTQKHYTFSYKALVNYKAKILLTLLLSFTMPLPTEIFTNIPEHGRSESPHQHS